jgi:hypothetical protein
MQSYVATFANDDPRAKDKDQTRTNVILSPDNDYLREFRGRK